MQTSILCSECEQKSLRHQTLSRYEVSALLGIECEVWVSEIPALICPKCKAVSLEGHVLETLEANIARFLISQLHLSSNEVKFLRKFLGLTQAELAERIGVSRPTVARWESSDTISPVDLYALRSCVGWSLVERFPHRMSKPDQLAKLFTMPLEPHELKASYQMQWREFAA